MGRKTIRLWARVRCPDCQSGIKQITYLDVNDYIDKVSYEDCEICKGSGFINKSYKSKQELKEK